MTLRDAIRDLNSFGSSDTLFVASGEPLSPEIPAVVAPIPEDDSTPEAATGFRIFLDVWHVRDIIRGKAHLAGLTAEPTLDQQLAFLLHYATHDA